MGRGTWLGTDAIGMGIHLSQVGAMFACGRNVRSEHIFVVSSVVDMTRSLAFTVGYSSFREGVVRCSDAHRAQQWAEHDVDIDVYD